MTNPVKLYIGAIATGIVTGSFAYMLAVHPIVASVIVFIATVVSVIALKESA